MTPTTFLKEQPTANTSPLIIERFLRDRGGVWQQILQEYDITRLTWHMVISSTLALACYGAVLGFSYSFLQALASAIKLPLLYMLTLVICLPTLYLFNLLYGGRLSMRQMLALIMGSMTITSALTLAFVPIVLFFLITAPSYHFSILLNVVILAFTAIVGAKFLFQGMRYINARSMPEHQRQAPKMVKQPVSSGVKIKRTNTMKYILMGVLTYIIVFFLAILIGDSLFLTIINSIAFAVIVIAVIKGLYRWIAPIKESSTTDQSASTRVQLLGLHNPIQAMNMKILSLWLVLYGFVGTQLAWTLRPFFGDPSKPFILFHTIEGEFFGGVIEAILWLLFYR